MSHGFLVPQSGPLLSLFWVDSDDMAFGICFVFVFSQTGLKLAR